MRIGHELGAPRARRRRPDDVTRRLASAAPRSTTASTRSGLERQGPRALDLDWRLTHLSVATAGAAPALLAGRQAGARLRLHGRGLHAPAPAARRRGGGLRHLARRDRPGQAVSRRGGAAGVHHRAARARASSTGSTATRCWSTWRTTRRSSASWWAISRRADRWWERRRSGRLLGSRSQAGVRRGAAPAGAGAVGPGPAAPLLPQPAPQSAARCARRAPRCFIFQVTPPSPPGAR